METIVLVDNFLFKFTPKSGFGIAIDLGTTTLVAQLVDLSNGYVVGVQTSRNPQTKYDSNIMFRILYGMTDNIKKKLQTITR